MISLAVTLLRLVGELQQWSNLWLHPASPVGITWLIPVFGVYFALRLANAGYSPARVRPALLYALGGIILLFAGFYLFGNVGGDLRNRLLLLWVLAVAAAALQHRAWPDLFRALLAYAYAARIPVVIIMFLAMQGNWRTHYDFVNPSFYGTGFWPSYLWLGFFPQLIFWVAFTIVVGTFFGVAAIAVLRTMKPRPALADFMASNS